MSVLARAYLHPAPCGPARGLFWLALAASILSRARSAHGRRLTVVTGIADRRGRGSWQLRPGWGVPLMIAAVLPWFVAIDLATHGFFADAVGGDLGRKLTSGDDAHGGPPGLHLLLLPLLLCRSRPSPPGAPPGGTAPTR